jgi:hypothetical protein
MSWRTSTRTLALSYTHTRRGRNKRQGRQPHQRIWR